MIKIRVDDFPGTKPEEFWRHNLDNFRRFDAVMEKHGLDYVLGVIPRHTTEDQIRYLRDNPRVEVAMHGVLHDENFPNEFRDYHTVKDVIDLIRSARQPLDEANGSPVTKYIPPHNVVDKKTLFALKECGFEDVFGGPGTDLSVPAEAEAIGLRFHGSHPPHVYGRSDELVRYGSVSALNVMAQHGDFYLTLHWTWEWNIGFQNLENYLDALRPALEVGRAR